MLKGDGICIITIPNGYGPKEMENRLYKVLYGFLGRVRLISPLRSVLRFLRGATSPQGEEGEEVDSKTDTLGRPPHIQFFTLRRFRHLLSECSLSILKIENRRFLSGPFSSRVIDSSATLINWNVRVADKLPHFLTSSWMFVVGHQDTAET